MKKIKQNRDLSRTPVDGSDAQSSTENLTPGELKNLARNYFKEIIKNKPPTPAQEKAIVEQLIQLLPRDAKVGIYQAKEQEINLTDLIEQRADIIWAYPCIQGEMLEFRYFKNAKAAEFVRGKFQILEPDSKKSMAIKSADLTAMLVPGLSFDRQGGRLGWGKGHYDRYLANYRGLKIGISRREQLSETVLPIDDLDVLMDMVVTEDYVIKIFSA